MGKKRRVWWVGGGAVCFVILFFVSAFLVSRNGPDARIERAVAQIVKKHGFEFDSMSPAPRFAMAPPFEGYTYTFYVGEPISQDAQAIISARLREACPSCTVDVRNDSWMDGRNNAIYSVDTYSWNPKRDSSIQSVEIVFDNRGIESSLTVVRHEDFGPWSFLRSLWPW